MLTDFKLPELGENIKGGTVVKVSVKVGQTIKKDQTVLELETDKASIEVPCPIAGVVQEILVKEGGQAKVGAVIMKIDAGATAPAAAPAQPKGTPAPATKPMPEQMDEKPAPKPQPQPYTSAPAKAEQFVPAADLASVPAAPTIRRLARELGIDIAKVPGSGPGGRISKEDVKAYAKQLITSGGGGGGAMVSAQPLPDFARFGEIERKPMNNIRKKTSEHLSHAWQTIPHVTQFDKTDITELEKLRKRFSTPDRKLTITPFIMKVMASALKTFPQFNTSIDLERNEIIQKKYCNIGVAVDTDRGLLVPVIRDVDKKSIFQIAQELNEISERARTKKTTIEEMTGGCFTLTNLGGIGGTYFTPIVNWPEAAILGISRSQWEPIYVEGQFVPRLMLPLSLSYDHRLIDGADGARFIRWIADAIQQPFLMELDKK
jgi:pyruvate dehydrogenase E2 component (dihydrolipoamide acetyltransferase)